MVVDVVVAVVVGIVDVESVVETVVDLSKEICIDPFTFDDFSDFKADLFAFFFFTKYNLSNFVI